MATDLFTGVAATTIATHDSNWFLGNTGNGEVLANLVLDGSGNCINSSTFGQPQALYTGTDSSQKSEIVIPKGSFVTISGTTVGPCICGSTSNEGFLGTIGAAQLSGETVTGVRMSSNGSFITTQTLSPSIDTSVATGSDLTVSLQRTSSTNVNLIVNGTTYNINTTGVDVATGQGGFKEDNNSATPSTVKITSWTNGVAGGAVAFRGLLLLGIG
jgi:hypothetical protein